MKNKENIKIKHFTYAYGCATPPFLRISSTVSKLPFSLISIHIIFPPNCAYCFANSLPIPCPVPVICKKKIFYKYYNFVAQQKEKLTKIISPLTDTCCIGIINRIKATTVIYIHRINNNTISIHKIIILYNLTFILNCLFD